MKRFQHKQFSKLLSLTLILVLLTMSFTGCVGNTDPTEPSDAQTPTSTEGTEATEATEEVTVPVETEPEVVMGTVNTDKLNVRTKANPNSPSVKKLAVGTRLEILEQLTVDEVTWGRIAEGWVNMKYVTLDGEDSGIIEDPGTTEATVPPETTPSTNTNTGNGTMGTVTASSLHVRKGPGTKYDSVGKVKKGDKIEILEKSGNWGKTEDGWVSLKYIDLDGDVEDSSTKPTESTKTENKDKDKKYSTLQTDGSTKALGTVMVNTSALNVRYGPSTDYEKAGTVYKGENVTYFQKSGNWIRIKEGWISLKYVTEEGTSTAKSGTGTVTASTLYIRTGPDTSYDIAGSLKKGDKVEFTEQQKVGERTWGKTKDGWICLDYVDID